MYPFETHSLTVAIEHSQMNSSCLVYKEYDSGLDPNFAILGWNLKNFNAYVSEHDLGNNTMSNFNFDISVERPFINSFAKNVLPLIIVVLISFLSFLIDPHNYDSRLGLAISSLLSVSARHISLMASYQLRVI